MAASRSPSIIKSIPRRAYARSSDCGMAACLAAARESAPWPITMHNATSRVVLIMGLVASGYFSLLLCKLRLISPAARIELFALELKNKSPRSIADVRIKLQSCGFLECAVDRFIRPAILLLAARTLFGEENDHAKDSINHCEYSRAGGDFIIKPEPPREGPGGSGAGRVEDP